jgi:hypothetical protein
MSSTSLNSQKVQRSNLQKVYSFYLSAALVMYAGLFLLLVVALFSIVQIDTEFGLWITFALLLLFGPFSFYLKSKNQNRSLKIPPYISEKVLKFVRNTTVVFFVLVFAFGILFYTYAPIKPEGNIFTDKIGNVYSESEYLFFKKWELTFVMSWCMAMLQIFVFMPFFHGQIKKWWKF